VGEERRTKKRIVWEGKAFGERETKRRKGQVGAGAIHGVVNVSGETSAERSHQNCGQLRIHSWWWSWCTCSVFFWVQFLWFSQSGDIPPGKFYSNLATS
jgi:hypothetical protein